MARSASRYTVQIPATPEGEHVTDLLEEFRAAGGQINAVLMAGILSLEDSGAFAEMVKLLKEGSK